MKIEDQVCSPKQGCKLKKLQVKAIPHYIWEFANKWHLCEWRILEDWIPAYTVAELMQILNKHSNWEFVDLRDNMAEYIADIVIKEIDGGHIKAEDSKL